MLKVCIDEQILYLLDKSPQDSESLLPPSPLFFLLPSADGGFQGPVVDGNDPSLGSAATPGTRLVHYLPAFPTVLPSASHSPPTATPISGNIIASPYPSYWCLLLGFAGVSPPPSGPRGRPNAWLCNPTRRGG